MTRLLTFEFLCNTMVKEIAVCALVRCLIPPDEIIVLETLQRSSDGLLTHAELFAQLGVSVDAENLLLFAVVIVLITSEQIILADPPWIRRGWTSALHCFYVF